VDHPLGQRRAVLAARRLHSEELPFDVEQGDSFPFDLKRDQLAVPEALLNTAGAVSREVAEAMASGVRLRFGAQLAAAVTGIAGPDAGGSDKPVGLTYIAVASALGTAAYEYRFSGDRRSNRQRAAAEALRLLVEEVQRLGQAPVKTA